MADEKPLPPWLASTRACVDVARDALLLLVVIFLVAAPKTVDSILSEAGFTRASILGFDWETQLEEQKAETEVAKQQVAELNTQLQGYVQQIDTLAPAIAEPAAKAKATSLAASMRVSQTNAAALGANLGRQATRQAELRNEFKARVRPPPK
jgi:hypothetical protein